MVNLIFTMLVTPYVHVIITLALYLIAYTGLTCLVAIAIDLVVMGIANVVKVWGLQRA